MWVLVIAVLVLLTAQAWTGDYVNLFAHFPYGAVNHTLGGLFTAVKGAGGMEVYHAAEGIAIFLLSAAIATVSFKNRLSGWTRFWSVWSLLAVVSASVGGLLFVFSGFSDNGASAQMGGSFLGAYAGYFLMLFFMR
jgi:hypothetical protein